MSEIKSCLYQGQVTHQRLTPLKHKLAYRVFMMLIDLDELGHLDRGDIWFGYNRRALFSFYDCDHGAHDKSVTLRGWVGEKLLDAGIDRAAESIKILCFPRVLGYAFNPLSILFCYNAVGTLKAVLYEVNNTFGEQHGYLFAVPDDGSPILEQACEKSFYVSPFMEMKARYNFRLAPPDEKFALLIRQSVGDVNTLTASWNGKRHAWSEAMLRSCFWRYPLLTLKIIMAIHWHGLRLFLKGAKFHRRPPLPTERVSVENHHEIL